MTHVQRFVFAAAIAAIAALHSSVVRAQEAEGEAPAPGQLMRDQTAVAAYEAGVKLLGENKSAEALARFNDALRIEPTWIEAYIGKGDALKAMEDYGAAVLAYSQVENFGTAPASAYNGRGEALLKMGRIDEASADFSKALELDPSNPVILSNVGHILINYSRDTQSAQAAIRRLNDALAQNPQDARAYRDRGWANALLQDFKAAEADLRKAAEVAPEDYENYAVLANIFLFQNNFAAANEALTQALNAYKPKQVTDPKIYLGGYLSRADAWLRIGDMATDRAAAEAAYRNAIADAEAVIQDNPERFPEAPAAQYRKGRAQRMLELYSDAVDSFTRALEGIPAGQDVQWAADAYMYRGICWYYIGSHDLARGDFEQASSVGGGFGDPRIFLWIGFTHHEEGDYREAIEAYSEAIAKSPKFAMAHTNRGRAYMSLREFDQAIKSFNNAVLAEPSVGEHYYNVAYAYTRIEDWLKAEHFLNIALRKENPQPKMYRLMATVLRERGRDDLAGEYERKANEAEPQQQAAGG
jgi:tetratricopeptide (TPR) repeat protein